MYNLPEMGGEVIQAMPERKHFFLMEVFRYVNRYLNVLRAFSECSPSECALSNSGWAQGVL